MNKQQIIAWLLEGDVAIQFQVHRDLLGETRKDIQERIAAEGWGSQFLAQRKPEGHWGDRFYQPKWISTHYTLLDLRNFNLQPNHPLVKASIKDVIHSFKAEDGGIQLGPSTAHRSDVCVNGMFLNYASYFQTAEKELRALVDALLNEIMNDGGFNCRTTRSGAVHSSLHSTISVLEGLTEFLKADYTYRKIEIEKAIHSAKEFILMHSFFRSDKTNQIIHKDFLKLPYPSRWKYDVLRALDYFQYSYSVWDNRMQDAISHLLSKRNKDGTWNVQAAYPGQVHVAMEKAGKPSRWNTLRAMRILKHFNKSV